MPEAVPVSIILPTFNRLQYLPAAVESIFAQTFKDWELLIADDGSGPETHDYLRAQKDPRVRVLWLPHSANPAAVRNAALLEARGEYIAFLDSDDEWLPDKLQRQVGSLRTARGCGWSYTGFSLVDESGNLRPAPPSARRVEAGGPILQRLLREEALVVTPSVLVRRELIDKAGGFNTELLVGEDFELWVRLASLSEADFIDRPLVRVRRHREHSFDDITCLTNLMRAMQIIQRSGVASRMNPVLDRRRAKIAANLAQAHARCQHRRAVWTTLAGSARYSWRYALWWRGAVGAAVRAFVPAGIVEAARKYRRRERAAIEAE
jgi:glycosyltransferase involved in cell wall biosynthesis